MTDRERDQIDADAEVYIKTCAGAIKQLRTQGAVLIISSTDLSLVLYSSDCHVLKPST